MRRFIHGVPAALLLAVVAQPGVCGQPALKKKSVAQAASKTLVIVNGDRITEADLARRFKARQVAPERQKELRRAFLDELIDAALIRRFLSGRKVAVPKPEVDREVQRIRELASRRSADPEQALLRMGYTPESLRDDLEQALARRLFFRGTLTAERIGEFFEARRDEFDGTQVCARQILIPVTTEDKADWQRAEDRLAELRRRIVDGELTFEEAARRHSQAPSAAEGGDVGQFPFRGKMPEEFSQQAFRLQPGELSQPFRTAFGAHLCQVTERIPGELSLEDVYDEVLAQMEREYWTKTAAELRGGAKIEWKE